MNCQEFENSIEVFARGALADARERAGALAHEESCAACAARLADERALSSGLRALASGMKGAEASAVVEASLLSAFRARAASDDMSKTKGAGNVVPLAGHVRAGQWSWVKTIAVASLAAAASLALFVLVRTGAVVNAPASSHEVAGGQTQLAMLEPPRDESLRTQTPDSALASSPDADEITTSSPAPVAVRDRTQQRTSFAPRARALNASYNTGGVRGGALSQTGLADESRADEITTEFIPLMQGRQYAQSEEGHLVRVELPRSALASFGLPVSAESSGGRVKADVLLGEDGIARAIRFVR
jgi:hypothetical protein